MRPEVKVRRRSGLGRALAIAFVAWSVFGAVCAATVIWDMRTHGHSEARILGYELLVWYGWAVATPVVAWLGTRLPLLPFSWRASITHVGIAIAAGLVHVVWWTGLQLVIRPFDAMGTHSFVRGVSSDLADRLFLEALAYFAVLGVTYAVDYQRKLRERELRAAQLEASLVQARLAALELQLQPHFLFNTLHAIGGLVRQARGPEAIAMIAGLSDLLRYSLDHAGKQLVPLEQEVAIIDRYLEIQRLRFSDRLAVTIDVPRDVQRVRVPALMLQPLVENAVRHGIERAAEPGTIAIVARRAGDSLVIEISNPGELAEVAEGIGITNTRERLEQLFGARHQFALRAEAGRVIAAVTLPFDEVAG